MTHRLVSIPLILWLLLLLTGPLGPPTIAHDTPSSTIYVTTAFDEFDTVGEGFGCSLREAIVSANWDIAVSGCSPGNGTDTIKFSFGMFVTLDQAKGSLPPLTEPVFIDASDVWNTDDDEPGVKIDGWNVIPYGLQLSGGNIRLYGLHITGFATSAVHVSSAYNTIGGAGTGQRNVISGNVSGIVMAGSAAHHNTVANNYVGMAPDGLQAQPNNDGMLIYAQAHDNTIGSTTTGGGNVITGNTEYGIEVWGVGTNDIIIGDNYIGLGANGLSLLGNGMSGVQIGDGAQRIAVGGPGIEGNMIVGNGRSGVEISLSSNHTVWGNELSGNGPWGLSLDGAANVEVFFNTITFNQLDGVDVKSASSVGNQIMDNSIVWNGDLGIDLRDGAHAGIAAPTIVEATTNGASGTCQPGTTTVQIYSSPDHEGETYHDIQSVNTLTNEWTYNGALIGPNITALAMDAAGNTSEFSAPYALSGPGTCDSPMDVICGQTVDYDTSALTNNLSGYTCGWDASGPEVIYRVTLPWGHVYDLSAELLSSPGGDLDVYLLAEGQCSSGQCLSPTSYGDWKTQAHMIPGGQYYVVVDGYHGAAGLFELQIQCEIVRLSLPVVQLRK